MHSLFWRYELSFSQEGFWGKFASFWSWGEFTSLWSFINGVDSWLKGDCGSDTFSQIKRRTITLCGSPWGVSLLTIIKSDLFAERLHPRVLKVDASFVLCNAGLLLAFKHPRHWANASIFPHLYGVVPNLSKRNYVIVPASHHLARQKHLFCNFHWINVNLFLSIFIFFRQLVFGISPPTFVFRL